MVHSSGPVGGTVNQAAWRACALCGAVGPLIFVGAVVLSSFIQDDYSWRREYISGLSARTAQHPWVMIAGFVLVGASVVPFAWSLNHALPACRWSLMAPILLSAAGVGLAALGLLRNDCSDALAECKAQLDRHNSWQSAGHDLVSIPTFSCLVVGPLACALRMRLDERWRLPGRVTFGWFPVIATVMVIDGLEVSGAWGGLVQRTHVLLLVAWTEMVVWRMLRSAQAAAERPTSHAATT